MTIKNQKDLVSGLMFSAVGIAFAVGASQYNLGTAARMGPGYFPLVLGIVLALLGAAISVIALAGRDHGAAPIGAIAWKPLGCVIGANVVFGVLLGGLPSVGLPSMGMVAAIFALVLLASLAADRFELVPVLVLSAILAGGSYVVFIVLLKLQLPVWPVFLSR